jgi:hypothetical protein
MPNDQDNWEQASAAATAAYDALPRDRREELQRVITVIMGLKESLVTMVTAAGSGEVCRNCGGECCLLGKYHVSILDLLAYRITGTAPVVPNFGSHPACPYADSNGCLIAPRHRPLTCVVFNCQPVEELLSPEQLKAFYSQEAALREAIAAAAHIWGGRIDRPLLLSNG